MIKHASMSTTFLVTMAKIKPEDADNPLWHGFSFQTQAPTFAHLPSYDASYQASPVPLPLTGRPQNGSYRSIDLPSLQTRSLRQEECGSLAVSTPSSTSHYNYPSFKRTLQDGNDLQNLSNLPESKEGFPGVPKPTINQGHRLLNFAQQPEKHVISDGQGRTKRVQITAQIHGMFFLSELATPSEGFWVHQPELTCYRRNLFQISGGVTSPRGPMLLTTERGEQVPIVSQELRISATESVDGHAVKLIVIPWKTPPPNSTETEPGLEHEPRLLPLVAPDEGIDTCNDNTIYPIAYRRLQFRIATANNGRRRELQQHFTLHLTIIATLANGAKVNICEASTAPIVVRGRSPRNFQARKEIPLVGSSSRGHAPEVHAAANAMPNTGRISESATIHKSGIPDLPRLPFTFDPSGISGSPSMDRQAVGAVWNPGQTLEQTAAPPTPVYAAPVLGSDNYLPAEQHNRPLLSSTTQPSSNSMAAPLTTNRHQFKYSTSAHPNGAHNPFVDNNPRPSKSPRHALPPEPPPNTYADYESRFVLPYNASTSPIVSRTIDYFPATLPTEAWTSAPDSGVAYGPTAQATNIRIQRDEISNDQYIKDGGNSVPHYSWNQS